MSSIVSNSQEAEKILLKVQEIQSLLKDIDDLMNVEHTDPGEPEDNVLYVIPHVYKEFAKVQGTTMSIKKIIDMYGKWTDDVFLAIAGNKGHFKKHKALKSHIQQCIGVCKTLEHVLEGIKTKT